MKNAIVPILVYVTIGLLISRFVGCRLICKAAQAMRERIFKKNGC
jgi:hypothetical protein